MQMKSLQSSRLVLGEGRALGSQSLGFLFLSSCLGNEVQMGLCPSGSLVVSVPSPPPAHSSTQPGVAAWSRTENEGTGCAGTPFPQPLGCSLLPLHPSPRQPFKLEWKELPYPTPFSIFYDPVQASLAWGKGRAPTPNQKSKKAKIITIGNRKSIEEIN